MWSYKLTFKALSDNLSIVVRSKKKELVKEFVYGLFDIFGDAESQKLEALQVFSNSKRVELFEFIEKFKDKFPPNLNQIVAFFNRLEENDFFFFIPKIDLTIKDNSIISNQLRSLKTNESVESLNLNFDQVYGNALQNYDVFPNGSLRKFIGDRNLAKRKCRFCGLGNSKTTFKQIAHAISEGLGNKKVFLYEECDVCNEKFSRELEPDLISFYSIFRIFYDVKGKGGSKKLKGKGFEIENNGEPTIKFDNESHRPAIGSKSYNLKLELLEKVNSQDIYRCLCKFVISVIDSQYVAFLDKTIKWINKDITVKKLPRIAELISYNHFTKEPTLFIYIRKNNNKNLPFIVGEFHLTCKILTFIVPLTSEDTIKFINKEKYNAFWKLFVHYKKADSWAFNDYSRDKERDMRFILDFQLPKKEKI